MATTYRLMSSKLIDKDKNKIQANERLSTQKLVNYISAETKRAIDTTSSILRSNKLESEHKIQERVGEISFYQSELQDLCKKLQLQLDLLEVMKQKVHTGLEVLTIDYVQTCQKCLSTREAFINDQISQDTVRKELLEELRLVDESRTTFEQVLESVEEQLRRLRSVIFTLNEDTNNKMAALELDTQNLQLTETDSCLELETNDFKISQSKFTVPIWKYDAMQLMEKAKMEINSTKMLCDHLPRVLNETQIVLKKQYDIVTKALTEEIERNVDIKRKLEAHLTKVIEDKNTTCSNIGELKMAIEEKEKLVLLALARLNKRSKRFGIEEVRDHAEILLQKELCDIGQAQRRLQDMCTKAELTLEKLENIEVTLRKDIHKSSERIEIDQVYCLPCHQLFNLNIS